MKEVLVNSLSHLMILILSDCFFGKKGVFSLCSQNTIVFFIEIWKILETSNYRAYVEDECSLVCVLGFHNEHWIK